jgi:uncharacterized lipoprotein YmbA
MMMPVRFQLAMLLMLLTASGCLGRSMTPVFYTLSPMYAPVDGTAGDGPAIGVGPADLPSYLERPQIAARDDDRISYADFDRWGASLESELLRVLGANLARALSTDRVAVYPAAPQFPIDIRVTLDVERFDGTPGGEVALDVRWALLPGAGGEPLATGTSSIREPVASKEYADLVAAHSAAVARLSRELAMRIKALEK